MKTPEEIFERIKWLCSEKEGLERQYSNVNQIDMLSGEGANLREAINIKKGMLKALSWVLH